MDPTSPSPALRRLVASAALQRVRWDGRAVEVPLAHPVRVDPDEVLLRLAEGGWLVISELGSAAAVRAGMRRWLREAEDGSILAILLVSDEVADALLAEEPDRTSRRLQAVLHGRGVALWDQDWPVLVDVLDEAGRRRPPPPEGLLDRLRARVGEDWPDRAAPPNTPRFERVVFGLAQAHDLVRLVRGEARLRLRGGGHLTVLAGSGDPATDDPALAAALASVAAGLAQGDVEPGLLVVDGPSDLVERASAVLGRPARLGRVGSVTPDGAVHPADRELAELVSLALAWDGPVDLWDCLDAGLARSRGTTFAPQAERAGDHRLGLVRGLLERLPGARLGWLEPTMARLHLARRELRIGWVGPEGGDVQQTLRRWRLAAVAARWTGHTIDLLLAGGDRATWDRASRDLPPTPEGHVFHLDREGHVHARAGLLGALQGPARALRRLARQPDERRRCSLDDLRRQVERDAVAEFRDAVADADFQRKLDAVSPWATRAMLAAIVIAWALQLRWGGTTGAAAVRMGALTGEGLLAGEPWRWISAAFLHGAWWHLGLNGLALWVLGRRLEAMIGPARLAILFVLSCIGGSMLHEATSVPGDIAVGASTGILGLLAAQGALVLVRPDLVPPRIRALLWREAWLNGVIILGISLLPFVGGMAHLGGALVGFGLIASRLLLIGVAPGRPADPGPTRVTEPDALKAAGLTLGGLAVAGFITALGIGRPWILTTDQGRVADTPVGEGRLTVPLPRSAGAPAVVHPSAADDGRELWVAAGDPLRDGLRVEARAVPHGLDHVDLDAVAALYGADEAWTRARVGRGQVLQSPLRMAEGARMVAHRWLLVRDGVVVDLRTTALVGTADARLSGTWDRLPAGVDAEREAWADDAPDPALGALQAARRGEDPPALPDDPHLHDLLLGLARVVRGEAPGTAWDEALDHEATRARALALTALLDAEVALTLAEAALPRAASPDERLALGYARASALERLHRYEDALDALDAMEQPDLLGLARAQVLWHLDRTDQAEEAAWAWWGRVEPWWSRPLGAAATSLLGVGDAGRLANRGWARLLMGDARACKADSQQALDLEPDTPVAAFNLALCTLVADGPDAARPLYTQAMTVARELGDDRAVEGASRDLRTLARREVEGAAELRERVFGEEGEPD